MARTTSTKVQKKETSQNILTVLLHGFINFLRAIKVFLYKKRTLKGMGEYLWTQ